MKVLQSGNREAGENFAEATEPHLKKQEAPEIQMEAVHEIPALQLTLVCYQK